MHTALLLARYLKTAVLILFLFAAPSGFGQTEDALDETSLVVKAVKANNLKEVMRLVEAGEPYAGDETWGVRPLDIAVQSNYREIALYLMKKNATAQYGFYYACQNGDVKWVQTLYDYGYRDSEAIIAAVEHNHFEVVKYLVGTGHSVNESQKRRSGLFSKYYVTPIELAIHNGNDEMVIYLVEHGVPVQHALTEAMGSRGELVKKLIDRGGVDLDALFLQSVEGGYKDIAAYTVQKGANPASVKEDGRTALLIAIEKGDAAMIDYTMHTLKLDINSVTTKNENALMLACKSGNLLMVKELLGQSANLEAENLQGETALFYANRNDNPEIFELLVAAKADLTHVTREGDNIVLDAARRRDFQRVGELMDKGVDYKLTNRSGRNLLSFVLETYDRYNGIDKEFIGKLLDAGMDVNTPDAAGRTLVFKAAEREDLEFLAYLRTKGAKMDPKDNNGHRPDTDNADVVRYLLENGADVNAVDDRHDTYMCVALGEQDLSLAAYLISKKINLEQPCYFDEPVLIKAIEGEDLEWVRYLVENGASVNVIGYFDRSAIEYANEKGFQPVIDYLKSKGALTKEERNKLVLAQMEEMKTLNALLAGKDLPKVIALLNKYPDLMMNPTEVGNAAALAAEKSSLELLKIVMERYRFDLNRTVNFEDQTILFIAAQQQSKDFVAFIVNKGADPNKEDAFGKTAADYAATKEIKTYLKEKMKP